MRQQKKFVPKTALIVSTILLAAGGIATTSNIVLVHLKAYPKAKQ